MQLRHGHDRGGAELVHFVEQEKNNLTRTTPPSAFEAVYADTQAAAQFHPRRTRRARFSEKQKKLKNILTKIWMQWPCGSVRIIENVSEGLITQQGESVGLLNKKSSTPRLPVHRKDLQRVHDGRHDVKRVVVVPERRKRERKRPRRVVSCKGRKELEARRFQQANGGRHALVGDRHSLHRAREPDLQDHEDFARVPSIQPKRLSPRVQPCSTQRRDTRCDEQRGCCSKRAKADERPNLATESERDGAKVKGQRQLKRAQRGPRHNVEDDALATNNVSKLASWAPPARHSGAERTPRYPTSVAHAKRAAWGESRDASGASSTKTDTPHINTTRCSQPRRNARGWPLPSGVAREDAGRTSFVTRTDFVSPELRPTRAQQQAARRRGWRCSNHRVAWEWGGVREATLRSRLPHHPPPAHGEASTRYPLAVTNERQCSAAGVVRKKIVDFLRRNNKTTLFFVSRHSTLHQSMECSCHPRQRNADQDSDVDATAGFGGATSLQCSIASPHTRHPHRRSEQQCDSPRSAFSVSGAPAASQMRCSAAALA